MKSSPMIVAFLIGFAWGSNSFAQEANPPQITYPRFRGANADGVCADDARLPDTWNKKDNVEWVADAAAHSDGGSSAMASARVSLRLGVLAGEIKKVGPKS